MVQIHYNNYKHIPESNGLLRGNNSQRNRACAASTRDFADLARRQYYKITTVGKCIGLNAFYFRVQDTDHISMILIKNRTKSRFIRGCSEVSCAVNKEQANQAMQCIQTCKIHFVNKENPSMHHHIISKYLTHRKFLAQGAQKPRILILCDTDFGSEMWLYSKSNQEQGRHILCSELKVFLDRNILIWNTFLSSHL